MDYKICIESGRIWTKETVLNHRLYLMSLPKLYKWIFMSNAIKQEPGKVFGTICSTFPQKISGTCFSLILV